MKSPIELSALEAARHVREGRLSSVELVTACLARIDETDGDIQAWAFVNAAGALEQAAELDTVRKSGLPLGALHGVPVGLKDIIDTRDMPTECGTAIFAGRQPTHDATVVNRLLEAGAVILGKTVSTEFAFLHPSNARNPHNPKHTPGGSSSGSAAAVAAYQIPLAIGTQTNGSVIRPASFCGVYGFKPSSGVVSRTGVLQTSKTLDQIGCFGRSLEDVGALVDAIGGYDPTDSLSYARPRPTNLQGARTDVPVDPNFIWFDMPYNDRLDDDCREGLDIVVDILGGQVERFEPAHTLPELVNVQRTIHLYEMLYHQSDIFENNWDQLSELLQSTLTNARSITRVEYEDALAVKETASAFFDNLFIEFDAVIAPSSTGQAPILTDGTGDPIFSTIWTLAGLPCVTLPVLTGADGLPVGVQLIGAREHDDRLLRTANWFLETLKPIDD